MLEVAARSATRVTGEVNRKECGTPKVYADQRIVKQPPRPAAPSDRRDLVASLYRCIASTIYRLREVAKYDAGREKPGGDGSQRKWTSCFRARASFCLR